MSVRNQINLAFFVARLIHLIVKISERSSLSFIWDDLLCKALNYLLSFATRMVYWLTSLISIERLCTTLFFSGRWLKKPHIAHRLILFTAFGVFISDLYQFFFYKSLPDVTNERGSICVLTISKADRSLRMTFHLLFLILNSLLPFLIYLFSTITISLLIVNQKMKTLQPNRGEFRISDRWKLRDLGELTEAEEHNSILSAIKNSETAT